MATGKADGGVSDRAGARLAALELAAAGAILGTLGVAVREAGVGSAEAVFWRCLFGGAALLAWCRWTGALGALRASPAPALALAALTGALIVLNWTLFFEAMARAGIAVATIAFHVHPALVLVLGAALGHGRLAPRQVFAVGAAFLGLLLAVATPSALTAAPPGWGWGVGAALLAACVYAWVTLLSRAVRGVPPAALALIQCAVGVPLLGLLADPAGGAGALAPAQWAWLLGLGLVHTGLVYALTYDALPRLPTGAIAPLLFVYPASAVAVDHLVYGTFVGPTQLAGLALIVAATAAGATRAGPRAATVGPPKS